MYGSERIRQIAPSSLVILSANDASKIDYAALRGERIDEIVDFNMPTENERAELLNGLSDVDRLACASLCHANLVRVAKVHRGGGNVGRVVRVMVRLQALSEESRKTEKDGKDASPDVIQKV